MAGEEICIAIIIAATIVIAILLIMTTVRYMVRRARGSRRTSYTNRRHEGYLIYPYIDLDDDGVRGSYYALSECPGKYETSYS